MDENIVTLTNGGIEYSGTYLDAAKLASFFAHESDDFYTFASADLGVSCLSSSDPMHTRLLGIINRYGDPVNGFLSLVQSDFKSLLSNVQKTTNVLNSEGVSWGLDSGVMIMNGMSFRFREETPRYFDFLRSVVDGLEEYFPNEKGVLVPNSAFLRDKNVRDRILKSALESNLSNGKALGWDIKFVQKYVRYPLEMLNGRMEIACPVDMEDGSTVDLPFCAVVALDHLVDSYFERRIGEALTSG